MLKRACPPGRLFLFPLRARAENKEGERTWVVEGGEYFFSLRKARASVCFTLSRLERELETSRPKARDGHRYPCPALVFCNGSSYGSRAAAPERTGGDEVL